MRIEGHKRFAATESRQGGIMSERRFKNGFGVFSVIGSMLLMVAPAIGAEDTEETPWMPGAVTQESISALEAVQLTLEHAPFIRLKEQDTLYREGIVLQAAGQFDMTLVGNLSYEYTQTQLTAQEAKGEQDRRDATEENLGFAQDAVEQNQTSLDESTAAREVWDSGGDVTSVRFSDPLAQAQYEILVQSYQSAPPDQQPLFEEAMINFFDAIMVDSQEGLDEAQARSAELEDQLDRMGDVPEVTQSFDASLNLMAEDDIEVGDFVLLHIGFIMNKIDKDEALLSIEAYREIIAIMDENELET